MSPFLLIRSESLSANYQFLFMTDRHYHKRGKCGFNRSLIFIFYLIISGFSAYSQGLAAYPSRIFFKISPAGNDSEKLTILNTGQSRLELGISVSDWEYDSLGNNVISDAGTLNTSAAEWIEIYPASYLVLEPGERTELSVNMNVPDNPDRSVPVRTAMIFLTQLNTQSVQSANGASIQVNIRSGIKVYHSFSSNEIKDIDVINFRRVKSAETDSQTTLELTLLMKGEMWLDGDIKTRIMNMQTGEMNEIPEIRYYALPGDKRHVRIKIPNKLKPGRYTATSQIRYGKRDEIKVAELEFSIP